MLYLFFLDSFFDPVPDELGPGIRMLSLTGSVYIDADDNTTNIGGEDGLVLVSPSEVAGVSESLISLAVQTPEPEGEGETEYTTDTLFLLSQAEAEPEGEGESETPLSVFLMSTVGNMLFARLDSSQELLAGMELTEDMTARLGNGTGATITCEPNGDVVVTLGSSSMMSSMGAGSSEALNKLSDSPLKQRKEY